MTDPMQQYEVEQFSARTGATVKAVEPIDKAVAAALSAMEPSEDFFRLRVDDRAAAIEKAIPTHKAVSKDEIKRQATEAEFGALAAAAVEQYGTAARAVETAAAVLAQHEQAARRGWTPWEPIRATHADAQMGALAKIGNLLELQEARFVHANRPVAELLGELKASDEAGHRVVSYALEGMIRRSLADYVPTLEALMGDARGADAVARATVTRNQRIAESKAHAAALEAILDARVKPNERDFIEANREMIEEAREKLAGYRGTIAMIKDTRRVIIKRERKPAHKYGPVAAS